MSTTSSNNVLGFGHGAGSTYLKGKIYRLKFWSNDTLVRDLTPCYRKSNNVIGLYDMANDVFCTNAGTGTFTKGTNVSGYEYH